MAMPELQTADQGAAITANCLGLLALAAANLHPSEEAHIFGLTNFSMQYAHIKSVLIELYPRGSWKGGSGGDRPARQRGHGQGRWRQGHQCKQEWC